MAKIAGGSGAAGIFYAKRNRLAKLTRQPKSELRITDGSNGGRGWEVSSFVAIDCDLMKISLPIHCLLILPANSLLKFWQRLPQNLEITSRRPKKVRRTFSSSERKSSVMDINSPVERGNKPTGEGISAHWIRFASRVENSTKCTWHANQSNQSPEQKYH